MFLNKRTATTSTRSISACPEAFSSKSLLLTSVSISMNQPTSWASASSFLPGLKTGVTSTWRSWSLSPLKLLGDKPYSTYVRLLAKKERNERKRHNGSSSLKAVQNHSYLSLLFHPFVEEKEEFFQVMHSILEELHHLVRNGTIWSVPCHKVGQWMLSTVSPL